MHIESCIIYLIAIDTFKVGRTPTDRPALPHKCFIVLNVRLLNDSSERGYFDSRPKNE
jgi:hypothetical protein